MIETDKGTGKITRYETKKAVIPKGATENNEMGFYLSGMYATIINEYRELIFELNLTLHHDGKKQKQDEVYLFWLQAIDEKKTEESAKRLEYETFYESFICAIRYDEGDNEKFKSKIRP